MRDRGAGHSQDRGQLTDAQPMTAQRAQNPYARGVSAQFENLCRNLDLLLPREDVSRVIHRISASAKYRFHMFTRFVIIIEHLFNSQNIK